jgi:hypothetical protein
MKIKKEPSPVTQEQRILECIDNERKLVVYCRTLLREIGPDGASVVKTLLSDHEKHIELLEQLLVEIQELRELSLAMAD